MNYIEEMMKTAGVNRLPKPCNDCEHYMDCGSGCITPYPDFTAEKQLEIIKLVSNFSLELYQDKYFLCTQLTYSGPLAGQDFTQALAQLTTELMKAGELDKEKVMEILNVKN